MFKSLTSLPLLITLLVAFIGQAMAYHYAGNNVDSFIQDVAAHEQSGPEHKGLSSSEDVDDCCEIECCESDCICPANVCASMVYLDTDSLTSQILPLSEPMLLMLKKDTRSFSTRRYRPPIFAS